MTLEQFRPISLLDVDGKTLMDVFAAWLSGFIREWFCGWLCTKGRNTRFTRMY